ncbi:MAG: tyrosine-type recombinase/integrase, partial [Akkermansia sp.]|nr:tyrosine-type recombinase/integrase [Akkermansia sp.]
ALIRKTQALHLRAGFSSARPWPPDALRHSYATWYLKNGGTINQLQLNMGHSSSGRATLT